MTRILTPQIGRRHVVRGLAAVTAAAALPNAVCALAAYELVATPSQTEGPFYPTDWSGDVDNDLVRVIGEGAQAQGQSTHILGRVLDTSGTPVPGAAIEIWQCDASGIYRHPRDTHWFRKRDGSF
jgi:protocatechuate 3,4-dioxygenase beta subunit